MTPSLNASSSTGSNSVVLAASATARASSSSASAPTPSSATSSSSPVFSTFRSFAYLAAGVACGLLIIRLWNYPSSPLFPTSFEALGREILEACGASPVVKKRRKKEGKKRRSIREERNGTAPSGGSGAYRRLLGLLGSALGNDGTLGPNEREEATLAAVAAAAEIDWDQDDDDDEEASRRRRRRRERQRRRRGVILDPDSPAARRRGRSEAGEDQAEEGSRRRRQRGVSAGEGSVERMRRRRRAQRTGSNGEYQRRRISGDEAETSLLDPEARQGLRRRRGRRDDGERDGDRDDANTTVISPDMSSPISPTSTGEEGTRRTGASAVARRRRSANGDEDNDGTAGESSSSRRRQLRQQNLQLDVSRRRRRGDPSNSTTASATASSSGQSRSRRLRPPAQSSSTAASPSTSSLRPQVESLSSPQESVTPTTPYTPATPYAADMSPRTAMLMAPPASAVSPIHPNSFGLGEIATPLSVNEEEPSSASTPLNLLSDEVVGTEEEGLRVETGLDTPTSPDFGGATSATPSSASNKGRVSWAVDVEGGAEENMDQEWEQRSSQTPTRLTPLSDLPPYPLSPAEVVAAALSPEPGSLHSLSNPGSPIFGLDIDNTTPTSATGVASGYLDVLDRTDFSNLDDSGALAIPVSGESVESGGDYAHVSSGDDGGNWVDDENGLSRDDDEGWEDENESGVDGEQLDDDDEGNDQDEGEDEDDDDDDDDDDYDSEDSDDYDDDRDMSTDEEEEDSLSAGYAEESKNLLNLLYSIAEDQARKDGYVHRSITCNHCGVCPVRGYRFKCAHCVDYDLCETCEAGDVHPRTHVFLKIRIPIPPHANPRSALLPIFYPGKAIADTEYQKVDFRELSSKTHFDIVELQAFYEQFRSLATVEDSTTGPGGITREVFEQCLGPLGLEKNLITERIFAFFDQDRDKLISYPELVFGLSVLCKGSLDLRIKYAFQGYDIDGDGLISRDELHRMFKAYFYLSMELVRDFVKTMEEGMMETFDDEASKPVSASFAAPIQGSGDPNDDDDLVKEDPGATSGNYNSLTRRKGKRPVSAHENDYSGSILLGSTYAPPPSATSPGILTRGTRALQEATLRRRSTASLSHAYRSGSISVSGGAVSPAYGGAPLTPISILGGGIAELPPSPVAAVSPGFDEFGFGTAFGGFGLGEGLEEQQWPIIEAMSQDAIDEMVEKTFIAANAASHEYITPEEFQRAVESDNSYLQWFEALGSIF